MTVYTTSTKVYNKLGITSEDISSSIIDELITRSDEEVRQLTGRVDEAVASFTEIINGETLDVDKRWIDEGGRLSGRVAFIDGHYKAILKRFPVTEITNIFKLIRDAQIGNAFSFDTSENTFTDNTTEANSIEGTAFPAFATTVGIGDIFYVGSSFKFGGVSFNLATIGAGGVVVWEYWNGSSWTTLSVTEDTTDADDLNASGKMTWTIPSDIEKTTVNGIANTFWVRLRVTTAHSTSPTVRYMFFDKDSVIGEEIPPNVVDFESEGIVFLHANSFPDGFNNIKIIYKAGSSSVPVQIEELSTILAAMRAVANLTGGSFVDISSYSLGSKIVSVGEPWINLREAMNQLKEEYLKILNQIGRRVVIGSV